MTLDDRNGTSMFKRLIEVVNNYNNSGHGRFVHGKGVHSMHRN
jgi:hypothetical protein